MSPGEVLLQSSLMQEPFGAATHSPSQVTITVNVGKLLAISGHYVYTSATELPPKCEGTLHMLQHRTTEQSFLDKLLCYNVIIRALSNSDRYKGLVHPKPHCTRAHTQGSYNWKPLIWLLFCTFLKLYILILCMFVQSLTNQIAKYIHCFITKSKQPIDICTVPLVGDGWDYTSVLSVHYRRTTRLQKHPLEHPSE